MFPLYPNTFHRLFQHSTQPQLDQLKTLITKFSELNDVVIWLEISLYIDIVYLTVAAYVIFLHLAYLLASILGFNVIQTYYTGSVLISLLGFMAKIKVFLLKTSIYLYDLMEILILHFCHIINGIFLLIKAKLLFYLKLVELQIYIDMLHLSLDLESLNEMLSKLKPLVTKYMEILETVRVLLNKLITLLFPIRILRSSLTIIESFYNLVCMILSKFKSIYPSCDKLSRFLCCLQQQTSGSSNGCTSKDNIIDIIRNMSRNNVTISIGNIDLSLIVNFYDIYNNIKKLLEKADRVVSKEIMSIKEQFLKVETINLIKLNLLIKQIQNLYLNVIIRAYLLICTILFYSEITDKVLKLSKSVKFDCCNAREFLGKCCKVEKYISTVSTSINECIIKLREACNKSEDCLGVRKELIELYSKIIEIVGWLKFYVDLIAMEILIFKMIILTLIVMCNSSFYIDELMLYIAGITSIDDGITKLSECYWYLQTFYFIQLENTISILGLSSALNFSRYINQYYGVLLLNLQSIQILIWVIECYIHHLIVFKYTSVGLNSLIKDIVGLLQIVVQIIDVISSISKIIDKLNLIKSSITKLNTIQSGMNILKWKESAQGIRQETQSINSNVTQINSELTQIKGYVDSIWESWATLVSLYYVLLVLISYVYQEIEKTKNNYTIETIIGNPYFFGLIRNVVGGCNKQLMYIFWYLLGMWVYVDNLIKIVKETILLIYKEMGLLSSLTKILKDHVNKIDKGVVDVECEIEGVVLNFIKCSTKQLSTNLINHNLDNNLKTPGNPNVTL